LTFVGAVGSGPVEVDCVVVALEILDALPLLEAAPFEATVTVTGTAEVTATVSRFWPKETPTAKEVVTTTLGDAVEEALLLCHVMVSGGE
jgi:hypothetical protein